MNNISYKVKFNTEEKVFNYRGTGIFDNNIIYYQEGTTKVIIDLNLNKLTRENSEMLMKCYFNTEHPVNSTVYIKELDTKLDFKTYTYKIINKTNYYLVRYDLIDNGSYTYEISWEEL